MSISSDDLINYAESLISSQQSSEVHLRSAASRSYYAVFHEAQLAADTLGLAIVATNSGEHEKLISRFSAGGKRLKVIASMLAACKRVRVDADYKIATPFHYKEAEKHIRQCKSIVAEMRRLYVVQSAVIP